MDNLRLHMRVLRKAGMDARKDNFCAAAGTTGPCAPIFHTPSDCGMFPIGVSVPQVFA